MPKTGTLEYIPQKNLDALDRAREALSSTNPVKVDLTSAEVVGLFGIR
jgi:hypothetical protein